MVAALFVETNGIYFGLPNIDPWDKQRDARLYPGPHPVIAHPPCERWGRYWSGGPSARVRRRMGDASTRDWFAKYDPNSSSWKTRQYSLDGGLTALSGIWPKAGMTRNGRCYQLAEWVPHIHGSACSLWHTPTWTDAKPSGQKEAGMMRRYYAGESIPDTYKRLRSQLAAKEGALLPANPTWLEWLMGFPTGWTETTR